MSKARVADYSAGKPGAAALRRAGFIGAVRYIGFDDPANPNTHKCTNAAELADFEREGLSMALVFEQTAGQWRNGYNQGRADAARARAHANRCGFPEDIPIYMAVDQDVRSEAEMNAAMSYLDGAADELGGKDFTGPYGEADVCQRAAELGFKYRWQCRAWSGNLNPETGYPYDFDNGARLFQHYGHPDGGPNPVINNVECDVNDVLADDWGQHDYERDEMSEAARVAMEALVPGEAGVRDPGETFKMLVQISERVDELKRELDFGETGVREAGEVTGYIAGRFEQVEASVADVAAKVDSLAALVGELIQKLG